MRKTFWVVATLAISLSSPSNNCRAQVVVASNAFSTGTEGWSMAIHPDSPFQYQPRDNQSSGYNSTGGNPGGSLSFTDTGPAFFFTAPAAYLGDKAVTYGGELRFDLRSDLAGGADSSPANGVIIANGNTTIRYDFAAPPTPANAWVSYAVPLSEVGWLNAGSNTPVSAGQMAAVLADLQYIDIRGEFGSGIDTGGLDNVAMLTPVPEPGSLAFLAATAAVAALRLRPRGRAEVEQNAAPDRGRTAGPGR